MRQLLQHRLKSKILSGGQASYQKVGQYIKRIIDNQINPALIAIRGWTGPENCYTPVPATFAGTSALHRAIGEASETNEGTISFWIWSDTGSVLQSIYDIGDPSGASGAETTRMLVDFSGNIDAQLSNSPDGGTTWNPIAILNDSPIVKDEYHHLFLAYKNDTVDGTDVFQIFLDGVQVGTDATFTPSSGTVSNINGDQVVIGARHDILAGINNAFTGGLADVWTTATYMEPVANIPAFRSDVITTDFVNGSPKAIGAVVNGRSAGNFMGGPGYTLADWNNGINNGALGDFTLVGDALTTPAITNIYEVDFNSEVTFTGHTGVTFVKNRGLPGEETLPATSSTLSPAQTIVYDEPVWAVARVAGDIIELDIGAGSNYEDASILGDNILPSSTWADFRAISSTWNSLTDVYPSGWAARGTHDASNFFELTAQGMRCVQAIGDIGIQYVNPGNLNGNSYKFDYEIISYISGGLRIFSAFTQYVLTVADGTFTTTLDGISDANAIAIGRSNNDTNEILNNISIRLIGAPIEAQTLTLVNCFDPVVGATSLSGLALNSSTISLSFIPAPVKETLNIYKLYRNGIFVTDLSLFDTSYDDVGLDGDTSYTYRIDTIDDSLNVFSTVTSPAIATPSEAQNLLIPLGSDAFVSVDSLAFNHNGA